MTNKINRTGLMGGSECPLYSKNTTKNKNTRKIYCTAKCPFEKGETTNLNAIDLHYQECISSGMITNKEYFKYQKTLQEKSKLAEQVSKAL